MSESGGGKLDDLIPVMSKLVLPPVGLEGQVYRGTTLKSNAFDI